MHDASGTESIGRWTYAVATPGQQHKSMTVGWISVVAKIDGVEPMLVQARGGALFVLQISDTSR